MLNSIGLANPGIEAFVSETLPALEDIGVPLWVSVGGFDAADYALCCEALESFASVETIELNVSCPNVAAPADAATAIVAAARTATAKPLYAKLSPSLPDLPSVAQAAAAAGADGLTLTNALRGMAVDPVTLKPRISTVTAGLGTTTTTGEPRVRCFSQEGLCASTPQIPEPVTSPKGCAASPSTT